MKGSRTCDPFFPPLEVSQTLRLVLFGCLPSSPWWLKIHSTLQGRERRRERSLHLIGVLEGRKACFQMLSEQSPGMWGQQHLEVFKHSSAGCVLPLLSEEQEAASCHFPSCHFQDQHLAPSFTSCCCVLPALKTDGTRASSMIFPTQLSVLLPLCLILTKSAVCSLHRATAWSCYLRCPV